MNFISSSQHQQAVYSGFGVDISRGQRIGRVSSEWFSRPDNERYFSLTGLYHQVMGFDTERLCDLAEHTHAR